MRMRRLNKKEIERNFPNEDVDWLVKEDGCVPVGSSILNLATMHIGTYCGRSGNECFIEIAKSYPDRIVYGWYNNNDNSMFGTVLIQCDEIEAKNISELAEYASGSLRNDGKSENLNGYFKFEIE